MLETFFKRRITLINVTRTGSWYAEYALCIGLSCTVRHWHWQWLMWLLPA